MTDILKTIEVSKRAEIAAAKARIPPDEMEARAKAAPPPRGFLSRAPAHGRRGPPRPHRRDQEGEPVEGRHPRGLRPGRARPRLRGRRRDLPVGLDRPAFLPGLREIPEGRPRRRRLPVLRKDFVFEPYQVDEARALGADAILIIMAAVTDDEAHAIESAALALGMDVLIEVHDEAELERALELSSPLIGINNRDLRTFETSLAVAERLAPSVPADRIIVGESGIFTPADVARLADAGVRAILVGESLMRAGRRRRRHRALSPRRRVAGDEAMATSASPTSTRPAPPTWSTSPPSPSPSASPSPKAPSSWPPPPSP